MFKNNVVKGIHESRFIASWVNAGGKLSNRKDVNDFEDWLTSLGLSQDEVQRISYLATNGKLEMETSAKAFLENIKD